MAPCRMDGWHQVEWLDGINLVEVLRATAMAWCWLARGLPRGRQSVSKDGIRLRPPLSPHFKQGFHTYSRLCSGCEDYIPYGKESIEAQEKHCTFLTNVHESTLCGCYLQLENTT